MSDCDFCHPEDYCELEGECKFRGDMRRCKAKPEDLIEICDDCFKPIGECECWKASGRGGGAEDGSLD